MQFEQHGGAESAVRMRKGKWFWLLVFAAGVIIIWRIKGALAPFFFALLLALFLKPLVNFLEEEKEVPVLAILVATFWWDWV